MDREECGEDGGRLTAWSAERPRILVVACSDGRMQEQIDMFLLNRLGIHRYDRLYVPGGPGALTQGGFEVFRASQYERECRFLFESHRLEMVVLLFHGCSRQGPIEAMCADYPRKLPGRSIEELLAQQEKEAAELIAPGYGWPSNLTVRAFRAEVLPDLVVRFVSLGDRGQTRTMSING